MVDGAVAYPHFLHGLDDVFKCLKVVQRIAVNFHIADVAAVGECMVGGFKTDFVEGRDWEVDRNVEGICVIVPVGDSGNASKDFKNNKAWNKN